MAWRQWVKNKELGVSENTLSPIEDVIEDARNGRMFILVDDEDRENAQLALDQMLRGRKSVWRG